MSIHGGYQMGQQRWTLNVYSKKNNIMKNLKQVKREEWKPLNSDSVETWALIFVSLVKPGLEWLPTPAATAGGTVVTSGFVGKRFCSSMS